MTTKKAALPVSVRNFAALHSVEIMQRPDGIYQLCHGTSGRDFGTLPPEWSAELMIHEIKWAIRIVEYQLL